MELFTTIGLGIGLVLAGFGIVTRLYFTFYYILPSVDRAIARALYSDDEPRNG